MDIRDVQILILTLLGIIGSIVGVYLILVLRDLRQTIRRANGILDDAQSVTRVISGPVGTIVGLAGSILEGVKAVNTIRSISSDERRFNE